MTFSFVRQYGFTHIFQQTNYDKSDLITEVASDNNTVIRPYKWKKSERPFVDNTFIHLYRRAVITNQLSTKDTRNLNTPNFFEFICPFLLLHVT